MGYQQQGTCICRQGLGQTFPHVDVQMVSGLIQKHKIGAFQRQFRKTQASQFSAGQLCTVFEHILAPIPEPGQMAANFQLCKTRILIPDSINDPACTARLLLGKDARFGSAPQPDHTAGRAPLSVQNLQQRGFTCAVRSCNDQLITAMNRVIQSIDQCPFPDPNGQILHDDQFVIGFNVVLEPKIQFPRFRGGCIHNFQFFQLLPAALGHLGRGGAYQIAVDILLQFGRLFHRCVVHFLLTLVRRLTLRQIGRIIAPVGLNGFAPQFPDLCTDCVKEIPVMADYQDRPPVGLEIFFQPIHCLNVQMVGGLVQNQQVRALQ